MPTSSNNRPRGTRRGSIYVVTICTALIVAVIALTGLTTARIQRRQSGDASDMRQALVYAESGLQIAKHRMNSDSQWRNKLANGTWASDQAIGDGFYSFKGSDPLDNNLTNFPYDPVIIEASGKKGSSVQKLQSHMVITQPGLSCLASGIHAKEDLTIDNITLNCSLAPISSDLKIIAQTNAKVYPNCESATTVDVMGGAQVFGTISQNVLTKQMPIATAITNYYSTNGTTILASSLPYWDRNYLPNAGAENGTTSWVANNCTLTTSNIYRKNGTVSFKIDNRNILPLVYPSYIYQDVTAQLAQNVNYSFEAWIYVDGSSREDNFRIKVHVDATGGNVDYTTPWTFSDHNIWTKLSGTGSLSWSGTLTSAYWCVETQLFAYYYFLDDCLMKETNAESSTRALHRVLLSPQSNPITNILNAQGIYVLECAGEKINIRDSRVQGTLDIKNPGIDSRIEGSLHLAPTVIASVDPNTPNLLALILDKKVRIALNSTDLQEAVINRNLNPAGTPYQGSVDTDQSDSYPSIIKGLVYAVEDLELGSNTTINGVVVGNQKVLVKGTDPATESVNIDYDGLYYYANPPVEFRATPVVVTPAGSVSRVVD